MTTLTKHWYNRISNNQETNYILEYVKYGQPLIASENENCVSAYVYKDDDNYDSLNHFSILVGDNSSFKGTTTQTKNTRTVNNKC